MDVFGPVLLFDGECGLCVRCVRLLLKADRRGRLRFAPLQSGVAQQFLRERELATADFDSAIFIPDWTRRRETALRFRSDAMLAAVREVGGAWRFVSWLQVVPRGWRDGVYCWVARRRRRFFGLGDVEVLSTEFGLERFISPREGTAK
jgi:predicted DCC family thiol-disulfide oxidoreductase YuxK